MSLNILERKRTKDEFKRNIALIGLTTGEVAIKLNIPENKLVNIIKLNDDCIENPWIVRNFIISYAQEHNLQLMQFSKLKGDYHNYLFLDSNYIDKETINR